LLVLVIVPAMMGISNDFSKFIRRVKNRG